WQARAHAGLRLPRPVLLGRRRHLVQALVHPQPRQARARDLRRRRPSAAGRRRAAARVEVEARAGRARDRAHHRDLGAGELRRRAAQGGRAPLPLDRDLRQLGRGEVMSRYRHDSEPAFLRGGADEPPPPGPAPLPRGLVVGAAIVRYLLAALLAWFGGLKFVPAMAPLIEPLVQHSPLLAWLYRSFSPEDAARVIGAVEIGAALLLLASPA